MYVPLLIAGDPRSSSALTVALALLAFLLGGALYAWCLWDFASVGGGTPAPVDAPKELVIRGPYRYTRNPMYMGVLTVTLGWAVLFRRVELLLSTAGRRRDAESEWRGIA